MSKLEETLSVVVPCYCEEESLRPLHAQITAALADVGVDYELVFVDDGSTDGTRSVLRELRAADPRVRWIGLTRNFGHQAALSAGLARARGQWVISMDADLQHPPEVLPELVREARKGFDIVLTRRLDPPDAGFVKRKTSAWFYALLSWLGGVRILPGSSDFQLLDRRALETLLAMPERHRFVRGLVRWTGFRSSVVSFRAHERFAGEPAYDLRRMGRLALDALFSFTIFPIRAVIGLGLLAVGAAVVYAMYALYVSLVLDVAIQGWTSLLIVVLMLGGLQIVILGVLGEYIARVYEEAKGRPIFVVQEEAGFESDGVPAADR